MGGARSVCRMVLPTGWPSDRAARSSSLAMFRVLFGLWSRRCPVSPARPGRSSGSARASIGRSRRRRGLARHALIRPTLRSPSPDRAPVWREPRQRTRSGCPLRSAASQLSRSLAVHPKGFMGSSSRVARIRNGSCSTTSKSPFSKRSVTFQTTASWTGQQHVLASVGWSRMAKLTSRRSPLSGQPNADPDSPTASQIWSLRELRAEQLGTRRGAPARGPRRLRRPARPHGRQDRGRPRVLSRRTTGRPKSSEVQPRHSPASTISCSKVAPAFPRPTGSSNGSLHGSRLS